MFTSLRPQCAYLMMVKKVQCQQGLTNTPLEAVLKIKQDFPRIYVLNASGNFNLKQMQKGIWKVSPGCCNILQITTTKKVLKYLVAALL